MKNIEQMFLQHVAQTYKRQPIAITRGRGVWVEDASGRKYLDFVGGIAVCSLGHCHPAIVSAICSQAKELMHTSNLYYIVQQGKLAQLLSTITPEGIEKFFFCNSGAEANEGAIKLAIKHSKRSRIVVMEGSFHGRTALTVGGTWKSSYREPFEAIIPKVFDFIPYNDLGAAERTINDLTAAVLVEPVQGEGGVNVPSPNYLPGLRKLCEERGAILICDEVQTGMGRTGRWFACQRWGVNPDIITMAKALGGGFPIGGFGAKSEVMATFGPGDHASTFGGNPLACAAAIATIKTMKKLGLPQRADRIGRYFMKRLEELKQKYSLVEDVRGLGLLIGMELSSKDLADQAVEKARKNGFLINATADKVLRFAPPLIVERKHIDALVNALDSIFKEIDRK
ncbi:MAG: aspartate aminotransferase family protein [Candidatus Hadarchaeales archaeon]